MALRWTSFFALNLLLAACFTTDNDSVADDDVAPRQYAGVWLYEFEGSTFLEGANEVPEERPSYKRVAWLDYHPDQQYPDQSVGLSKYDDYDEAKECYPVTPLLVKFIGRRKTGSHGSGHLGLWSSEFSVDEMISSKPLGSPFCFGG